MLGYQDDFRLHFCLSVIFHELLQQEAGAPRDSKQTANQHCLDLAHDVVGRFLPLLQSSQLPLFRRSC